MRTCKNCNVEKPLTEFYFSTIRGKKLPKPNCKACIKAMEVKKHTDRMANDPEYREKRLAQWTQWKLANPERAAMHGRLNTWKKQGIDPELAEQYFQSHNGLCDLCHEPANGKTLVMDHCHETGTIRGMLHSNCNILIGMAKDSPRMLILAIDYLNRS